MRKNLTDIAILGFGRFGGMLSSLLAMNIFNTMGLTEMWGELILFITYSSVFGMIAQFGQGSYLLRHSLDKIKLAHIYMNSIVLAIPFAIAGSVMAYVVGINEVSLALLCSPLFTFILNYTRFLQKSGKSLLFSFFNSHNFFYFIVLLGAVVTLYGEASNKSEIFTLIAFVFLFFCFFALFSQVTLLKREFKRLDIKAGFAIIRESKTYLLIGASMYFMSWIDTFMLGAFHGNLEVGLYNNIFKVASLMTIILSLLNSVVAPKIADAFSRGPKELQNLVRPFNRIGLAVSLLFFVGVLLNVDLILNTFLGLSESYVKMLHLPLVVLSIGYIINSLSGNVGYMLQMTGNGIIFNKIVFSALIANVAFNILLIPSYGILGAAIASTISMGLWNIASFIYSIRKIDVFPI